MGYILEEYGKVLMKKVAREVKCIDDLSIGIE